MPSRALCSVLGTWLCLSLVACGDDDPKGPSDASTDAAPAMDSGGIFIPRRDAGPGTGSDPIRECDRFDPNSCPAGQTCDVLVRVFEGTNQLSIYSGCVTTTRERGEGDPCEPDFTTTPTYQTEGLTDLVWRDQCGPGLVCAPDSKIRGGSTCQRNCVSGLIQEDPNPVPCEDQDAFCVPHDVFREACRPSDGCDVINQTGCRPGYGCYLRTRDDGTGFISVCFPPSAMQVADGQSCRTYNACRPGSSCNGPLRKALSQWTSADLVCRPACDGEGNVAGITDDAGQDDGGTPGGSCSCLPFSQSGLSTSGIPNPPYGQCE